MKQLPRRDRVTASAAAEGIARHLLLHVFISLAKRPAPSPGGDAAIRRQILAAIEKQEWAPLAAIAVSVIDGTVELRGAVTDQRQYAALRVLAENVPGVNSVRDRLVWGGCGALGF